MVSINLRNVLPPAKLAEALSSEGGAGFNYLGVRV